MQAALHGAGQLVSPGLAVKGENQALEALYAARAEALIWSHDGIISRQAVELAQILHNADRYGLEPLDYANDSLATKVKEMSSGPNPSVVDFARLDVSLSLNVIRFISHLHFGRIDPLTAGFELKPRRVLDVGAALEKLAIAANVTLVLDSIEPQFFHYLLLKQALHRYQDLASNPRVITDFPVPEHVLRGGDSYAGAPGLRNLLMALGDLPIGNAAAMDANEARIDPQLIDAIKRFQSRHGLRADGLINRSVFATLSTPMPQRVRQIELTLERWRWLPPFETPPIIVNIPAFRLFEFQTVEDRVATVTQMDVIVGESYPRTQTPIFLGDMRYVVFRPYWDIPRSITLREMLPKIQRQAGYLSAHHLEIVRGQTDAATILDPTPAAIAALAAGSLRLRQQPGDANALGLVKFIFPNVHNVYLHSTPAQELFLHSQRAFSHGCIRVSDPGGLAQFVLRNAPGDWDRAHIDSAMNGANSRRVELSTPIRVMILYATAQATEGGAH